MAAGMVYTLYNREMTTIIYFSFKQEDPMIYLLKILCFFY